METLPDADVFLNANIAQYGHAYHHRPSPFRHHGMDGVCVLAYPTSPVKVTIDEVLTEVTIVNHLENPVFGNIELDRLSSKYGLSTVLYTMTLLYGMRPYMRAERRVSRPLFNTITVCDSAYPIRLVADQWKDITPLLNDHLSVRGYKQLKLVQPIALTLNLKENEFAHIYLSDNIHDNTFTSRSLESTVVVFNDKMVITDLLNEMEYMGVINRTQSSYSITREFISTMI